MAKQNTLPKGNKPNHDEFDELKAKYKANHDCAKRVEELKYKLFQITEKHILVTIRIIRKWIKT